MTERADVGAIKLPSTGIWRSLFNRDEVTLPQADPLHCDAPVLRHAESATALSARERCMTVLQAARKFIPTTPTPNDRTTLAWCEPRPAITMRSETPALTAPRPAHITVSSAGRYNDLPEAAMYQPSARNCSIERS